MENGLGRLGVSSFWLALTVLVDGVITRAAGQAACRCNSDAATGQPPVTHAHIAPRARRRRGNDKRWHDSG
jgi:hypothetical protein